MGTGLYLNNKMDIHYYILAFELNFKKWNTLDTNLVNNNRFFRLCSIKLFINKVYVWPGKGL